MTSNDVCEQLCVLEKLIQHLDEKTGVSMPDLQSSPDPRYRPTCSSSSPPATTTGAITAYRTEANVDLPTASRFIESL
jgi:hypothetical protein